MVVDIVRYENRKLYTKNLDGKARYISLHDLIDLVKKDRKFQIRRYVDGVDLTRPILASVVHKYFQSSLTLEALKKIIKKGEAEFINLFPPLRKKLQFPQDKDKLKEDVTGLKRPKTQEGASV